MQAESPFKRFVGIVECLKIFSGELELEQPGDCTDLRGNQNAVGKPNNGSVFDNTQGQGVLPSHPTSGKANTFINIATREVDNWPSDWE